MEDNKTIMNELGIIKQGIISIREEIADSSLTSNDLISIENYKKEKENNSLVSHEEIKKELNNADS